MPSPRRTPLPAAPPTSRRHELLRRRAAPLAAVALLALVGGLIAGARHVPAQITVAERFMSAWTDGDYAAMHGELTEDAQRRMPLRSFRAAYKAAAATATLRDVHRAGTPRRHGDAVVVAAVARTRLWGALREPLRLRFAHGAIDWQSELVFPGLRHGERLTRDTRLPTRATILARDGGVLARGEGRSTPTPELARAVVGSLGPIPPGDAAAYARLGVPDDARVGVTGLERELDRALIGRPGGSLRAGHRRLARVAPRRAHAVRSTIDPTIERAAIAALAERPGGIAVLQPATGEVLALAGFAFSGLQPPGSTFKIITTAAALESGLVKTSTRFPPATEATLDGVTLSNADGERCGGTLVHAFAVSCNSVFAPLGARLGAKRLVDEARDFGFNEQPSLRGAAEPSIPAASDIQGELALGSTAIGQGKVLATALSMASVAATIAHDGRRVRPTVRRGAHTKVTRAVPRKVAAELTRMMRAVVTDGTGTAAALPSTAVAGKTGTAELRDTTKPAPDAGPDGQPYDSGMDTDAWFAAFAPARRPKVALAVLLTHNGQGGTTAAPVAKQVLQAALSR